MPWKDVAEKFGEYGEHTQAHLKKEYESCLKAPHFTICMRSAVIANPVLNRSRGAKSAVLGWTYWLLFNCLRITSIFGSLKKTFRSQLTKICYFYRGLGHLPSCLKFWHWRVDWWKISSIIMILLYFLWAINGSFR
jgi:hypothetical protein